MGTPRTSRLALAAIGAFAVFVFYFHSSQHAPFPDGEDHVKLLMAPPPNGSDTGCSDLAVLKAFDIDNAGKIRVGPQVRRVVIDIGLSGSPMLPAGPEEMVIGFEPLPESLLVSEGRLEDHVKQHGGAYVVLQAAVSEKCGYAAFNQNVEAETSSLLAVDPLEEKAHLVHTGHYDFGDKQYKIQKRRLVPVVTLAPLLAALPPQVELELLKIDAQGADLMVVKGAGIGLLRAKRVQMEGAVGRSLYAGGPTRDEVVGVMEAAGFKLTKERRIVEGLEADLEFHNMHKM
eukprot:TRINITY_DN3571_c0_g2_i1.p1 TRINITY_DN3571_c0_g2~~TRINITY_DN3571_c0_g2_i1.p1  ORF type:complete len:288 (-),score=55.69 TRINITY_DN3571_c0_g2_i1:77-940(-)